MANDALEDLECNFNAYVKAYETKSAADRTKYLKTTLHILLNELNYSKSDITFACNVEPLTLERWLDGKGMRAETFAAFAGCCKAIIAGKSQRPIKASDIGFVTWRYQVEHEQLHAKRIWHVASSALIPVTFVAFMESIKNLLSKKRQDEANLPSPVKIYLYPPKGEVAESLITWDKALDKINSHDEPLRGSVIAIADDSLPWFLPAVRILILENTTARGETDVKGYIRVPLEEHSQNQVLSALDPDERSPDTPWLAVNKRTVEDWFYLYQEQYGDYINHLCKEQKDPFKFHFVSKDDLKKWETRKSQTKSG